MTAVAVYDATANALYVTIDAALKVHRTVEIDEGTNVDIDVYGNVHGIEVLSPNRLWPLPRILRSYGCIQNEDALALVGMCPFTVHAGAAP